MKIAVVDSGSGNLRSAVKAFEHLGAESALTDNPSDLAAADALVLPGQGAFGDGMAGLARRGLVEPLREQARAGKPVLGICIGLQLFFERSEESPDMEGLGLLKGEVVRFKGTAFGAPGGLKVPHMGWNALSFPTPHPIFKGLEDGVHVYFVHSYYAKPAETSECLAVSEYSVDFCASAGTGRIVGCQFHPEKSQSVGLKILRNFLVWVEDR
jgi:glutamine amidotransferase